MAQKTFSGSFPMSPNFLQMTRLYASGHRSYLKFYFDRLHQYELFYTRMIDDYVAQLEKFGQYSAEAAEEAADNLPVSYESALLKAQADAAHIIGQAKAQAERILEDAYKRSEANGTFAPQSEESSARRKSA